MKKILLSFALTVYKGDKYDDTAISEVLFLGCY